MAEKNNEIFGLPVWGKKPIDDAGRAQMASMHDTALKIGIKRCFGLDDCNVKPSPTFTEDNYQPKTVFFTGSPASVRPPAPAPSSSASNGTNPTANQSASGPGSRLCRPDVVREEGGYAVNLTTGGKVPVSGPSKNKLKQMARAQKAAAAAGAASGSAHPQRKSISDIDIAAARKPRRESNLSDPFASPAGLPSALGSAPAQQHQLAGGIPPPAFAFPAGVVAPAAQSLSPRSRILAALDNNRVSEHGSITTTRDVGHADHVGTNDAVAVDGSRGEQAAAVSSGADVAGVVEQEGLGSDADAEGETDPDISPETVREGGAGMSPEDIAALLAYDGNNSSSPAPTATVNPALLSLQDDPVWVEETAPAMDLGRLGDGHDSPQSGVTAQAPIPGRPTPTTNNTTATVAAHLATTLSNRRTTLSPSRRSQLETRERHLARQNWLPTQPERERRERRTVIHERIAVIQSQIPYSAFSYYHYDPRHYTCAPYLDLIHEQERLEGELVGLGDRMMGVEEYKGVLERGYRVEEHYLPELVDEGFPSFVVGGLTERREGRRL